MNYSKEEQERIMKMSPEEWQEFKNASDQFEQDSEEYIQLKLKLEAERAKYIEESQKLDKEVADHFHKENLAEYERLQNEFIQKEKEEYLRKLQNTVNNEGTKKKSYVKYIIIGVIVIVLVIIITAIVVSNQKDDATHFTREEMVAMQNDAQGVSEGHYDKDTGIFIQDSETKEMTTQDLKLYNDSRIKLFYENHSIGIMNYSRNIDMSLFTQKNTKDGFVQLEPKRTEYYQIKLYSDTNKDNRTIRSFIIDYDNLRYLNDNNVYCMFEDYIINRSTTYNDVKNYFSNKTNDIREYVDSKKHAEININNIKITVDSFEDEKIKPVGTVDKITVEVAK